MCVCDDLVCACCPRVKCRVCFKTCYSRPSKSTHISYSKPKNIMLFQQNKRVGPLYRDSWKINTFSIIRSTWAHTQYNHRANQQQQAVVSYWLFYFLVVGSSFQLPLETFLKHGKRLMRKQMKIHHLTVYCGFLRNACCFLWKYVHGGTGCPCYAHVIAAVVSAWYAGDQSRCCRWWTDRGRCRKTVMVVKITWCCSACYHHLKECEA